MIRCFINQMFNQPSTKCDISQALDNFEVGEIGEMS
jgi:hypothetical protein